jgi:hypothetical protein
MSSSLEAFAALAQIVYLLVPVLLQAIVLDQADQFEQEEMLDPSICVHEQFCHL